MISQFSAIIIALSVSGPIKKNVPIAGPNQLSVNFKLLGIELPRSIGSYLHTSLKKQTVSIPSGATICAYRAGFRNNSQSFVLIFVDRNKRESAMALLTWIVMDEAFQDIGYWKSHEYVWVEWKGKGIGIHALARNSDIEASETVSVLWDLQQKCLPSLKLIAGSERVMRALKRTGDSLMKSSSAALLKSPYAIGNE